MDLLKNCKFKMNKGSFYNGMKLIKDIEVINGEPYVNGLKSTWEDVTFTKEMSQRVVNRSFSHIKNMTIKGHDITIDGMPIDEYFGRNEIVVVNITINGNVEKLKADSCETITIYGDVERIDTMSGKVYVSGNVKGDVETMSGSVIASKIYGDVSTTSGNINR